MLSKKLKQSFKNSTRKRQESSIESCDFQVDENEEIEAIGSAKGIDIHFSKYSGANLKAGNKSAHGRRGRNTMKYD